MGADLLIEFILFLSWALILTCRLMNVLNSYCLKVEVRGFDTYTNTYRSYIQFSVLPVHILLHKPWVADKMLSPMNNRV